MWWPVLAVLALGGCAQIFGLETTSSTPDTQPDAATPLPDGRPACLGGDARSVDPMTGHCFVFFTTPMTRDAARSVCQTLGSTAHLASIQSVSESTIIATLIGATNAFIGGSDELTEGTFVWDDGTPVQLTSWNTGEPNNAVGQFEEDCIVVLGSTNGLWNDEPCAPPPGIALGMNAFVCERD